MWSPFLLMPTQYPCLGPLANAQNVLITGGTFVSISRSCVDYLAIVHRLQLRTILSTISIPILVKRRRRFPYFTNQILVHCLLDGKMYSINLARSLLIVLIANRGALVSSGEWEGSERLRSVSNLLKKWLIGKCIQSVT